MSKFIYNSKNELVATHYVTTTDKKLGSGILKNEVIKQ